MQITRDVDLFDYNFVSSIMERFVTVVLTWLG